MIFTYIKIGIVVAVLAACGGAYAYVKKIERENDTLQDTVSKQEAVIGDQQDVIVQQAEDTNDIRTAYKDLEKTNKELSRNLDQLRQKFYKINASGERRDLGALALNKTGLVEKIINKATSNSFRCIEIATGAELTDDEINATKRSEINPECTSIANPQYVPHGVQ